MIIGSHMVKGLALLLESKMESNAVEKATMNQICGILLGIVDMANMAEPVHCKRKDWV